MPVTKRILLASLAFIPLIGCKAAGKNTAPVRVDVSGLAGTMTLAANTSEHVITKDGSYIFDLDLRQSADFEVSVKSQPDAQTCTVTNGNGSFNSRNEAIVSVSCGGGSGSGALGSFYITALVQNTSSGGQSQPGYWYGGVASILPKPSNYGSGIVSWGIRSGDDIYVSGYVYNDLGNPVAGYWKNGVFAEMPLLVATKNSFSSELFVENNDIYLSGYAQNGTKDIAGYWKNGSFVSLTTDDTSRDAEARGIAVVNGNVYAAGQYFIPKDFLDPNSKNVYKPGLWKDGVWTSLDLATAGLDSAQVGGISIKDNDVYIGGAGSISTNRVIGYWKNGTWVKLADYTPKFDTAWPAKVSLFDINDDIYVVSDFQTNGVTGGYFKNDVFISLPAYIEGNDCRVVSFAKVGSTVVAGGWCSDEMDASVTGYWVASDSSPVFKPLSKRSDPDNYSSGGHVIP